MKYDIRVKEHLDLSWQEWFDGLQIVHEHTGTSLLSGSIRDQAALYGILQKVRHLGLTLLSVDANELRPQQKEENAI